MKLVDQSGNPVVFQSGMGIFRHYAQPDLLMISSSAGKHGSPPVYFQYNGETKDNKLPVRVVSLYEIARLISAITGLDVIPDQSINPSVGEGYSFI